MARAYGVRIWTDHPNIRDVHTDGTIKTVAISRSEISAYVMNVVSSYLDLICPNMDPPLYVYYYPSSYSRGQTILDVMIAGTPSAKIGEIYVDVN